MVDLFHRPRSFYDARFNLTDYPIDEECPVNSENGAIESDVDGKCQKAGKQLRPSTTAQQTKDADQTNTKLDKVNSRLNTANKKD